MMQLHLGNENYNNGEVRIPWQEEKEHIEIELYLVDNRGNVSPLCSTFSVEGEMRVFDMENVRNGICRSKNN